MTYTFCYISSFSLFKLLCTLVRLCKETLLLLIRINFPSRPCSPLQIFIFPERQNNKGKGAAPIIALHSPTHPPLLIFFLPHPLLITCQSKLHTAPCHSESLRTPGGKFPLCFAKYSFSALTLFLLWYYHDLPRVLQTLDTMMYPMYKYLTPAVASMNTMSLPLHFWIIPCCRH